MSQIFEIFHFQNMEKSFTFLKPRRSSMLFDTNTKSPWVDKTSKKPFRAWEIVHQKIHLITRTKEAIWPVFTHFPHQLHYMQLQLLYLHVSILCSIEWKAKQVFSIQGQHKLCKHCIFRSTLSRSSPISSLERNDDINPDSLPRTDMVRSVGKNKLMISAVDVYCGTGVLKTHINTYIVHITCLLHMCTWCKLRNEPATFGHVHPQTTYEYCSSEMLVIFFILVPLPPDLSASQEKFVVFMQACYFHHFCYYNSLPAEKICFSCASLLCLLLLLFLSICCCFFCPPLLFTHLPRFVIL